MELQRNMNLDEFRWNYETNYIYFMNHVIWIDVNYYESLWIYMNWCVAWIYKMNTYVIWIYTQYEFKDEIIQRIDLNLCDLMWSL
jgi:hypothetical protein